jgi:hypothetical protein
MIALGQLWRSQRETPADPAEEWDCGHYIVVLGVDREYVYFQDPYLRMGKGFVTRRSFERHWHQVMGGDHDRHPKLLRLGIFVRGKAPAALPERTRDGHRELDLEKLGSLNLIRARFRGVLLPFDFMDRLRDLWGSGDIRPAAFVLVRKSADGEISAMEGGSLADDEDAPEINAVLAAMTSRSIGRPDLARCRIASAIDAAAEGDFGLSVAELHEIARQLPPDSSVMHVLFENAWERRFRDIAREHGGEVDAQRLIGPEVMRRVAEELRGGEDRPLMESRTGSVRSKGRKEN